MSVTNINNEQKQIENLQFQLQAVDETLQDAMRMNIALRSNIKAFQKENQNQVAKVNQLEQTVVKLTQELNHANSQVSELSAKLNEFTLPTPTGTDCL